MTNKKNKIEVTEDNPELFIQKKDLEKCETDLELANKTIVADSITKKEQKKQLKIAQREAEKATKI